MVNEKLIAGAVMILLNLVVLAPIATSMVEDAVEDNFETYPYDSACADSDCTTAEEDWSTSTSEKTYYAWNLTNLDEVMSGDEPTYEKVGPFLYDITTTRNIIEFNESAGTLTYDESNSFSCSADTLNPCDTMITQLNIPFQPQVVGATGTAINGIMDLTKAGFAAGAIGNEMESFSAGQATADGIATSYGGIQAGAVTGSAVDAANASMMLGMGWYDAYDAFFAAMNLSGLGDTVTYTMAIQGLQAGEAAGVTFAGNASIGDLSYAFDSAVMPTGEDASLTSMQGVLILAGHCNAFATATYGEVMADAANGFANVGTMQRASIWGYASADINATIATDFAVCFGVGGTFSMTHGGADDDWFQDPLAVDASTRMMNYLGLDIDNTVAMNLLFGGQGTDMPTGILATNLEGTSFGIAAFAGMDAATAMTTYSLDATQYAAVGAWVGGWLTSATALPMILLGGTGTMTAEEFVNVSFGAADPVNGGYLDNSINLGGAWGTALIPASEGAPSIDLAAAVSGNILYGPLGLTTATGATIFLFGELTGMTPPIDFTTMAPGAPMEWNAATIQALYGVDANAANALRTLMMSVIYGDFVPGFLVDSFGSSGQYMTMPLDNWLFGWRDPVSAFVAGDVTDPSLGWSKLETNETYFGSGGISTGPASIYVECTGHNSDCDKGEAISEDGSNQLSWR
ncbi:CD36 family protein, partial [Candidatus Poseidoniaceae archaeon]|nr:CD36 family protein [Candidatus Poseidoniaceae archaeon]